MIKQSIPNFWLLMEIMLVDLVQSLSQLYWFYHFITLINHIFLHLIIRGCGFCFNSAKAFYPSDWGWFIFQREIVCGRKVSNQICNCPGLLCGWLINPSPHYGSKPSQGFNEKWKIPILIMTVRNLTSIHCYVKIKPWKTIDSKKFLQEQVAENLIPLKKSRIKNYH